MLSYTSNAAHESFESFCNLRSSDVDNELKGVDIMPIYMPESRVMESICKELLSNEVITVQDYEVLSACELDSFSIARNMLSLIAYLCMKEEDGESSILETKTSLCAIFNEISQIYSTQLSRMLIYNVDRVDKYHLCIHFVELVTACNISILQNIESALVGWVTKTYPEIFDEKSQIGALGAKLLYNRSLDGLDLAPYRDDCEWSLDAGGDISSRVIHDTGFVELLSNTSAPNIVIDKCKDLRDRSLKWVLDTKKKNSKSSRTPSDAYLWMLTDPRLEKKEREKRPKSIYDAITVFIYYDHIDCLFNFDNSKEKMHRLRRTGTAMRNIFHV